jgi:hypothetical protein
MLIRRSRKNHILIPRKVTAAPIGCPSLILKPAIARFARVTTGFCPEILVRSLCIPSKALASSRASPAPIFITIFFTAGASIIFLYPNSSTRAAKVSFLYCRNNLGCSFSTCFFSAAGAFAVAVPAFDAFAFFTEALALGDFVFAAVFFAREAAGAFAVALSLVASSSAAPEGTGGRYSNLLSLCISYTAALSVHHPI